MKEEREERTINMFCPSSSKAAQVVARDDQRLDLGSIARTFGLIPATLKLNGHFISRGVDFIASSVTWKSLISFFSSRGLSTGTDDGSGALVVEGKLCKPGSKRAHDSAVCGIPSTSNQGYNSVNIKSQLDEVDLVKKKRRSMDLGLDTGCGEITKGNAFNLKRKHCTEDIGSPKRIRGREDSIGLDTGCREITRGNAFSLKRKHCTEDVGSPKRIRGHEDRIGYQRKESSCSETPSTPQFPCRLLGLSMKRLREDEMVTPSSSCKKIR